MTALISWKFIHLKLLDSKILTPMNTSFLFLGDNPHRSKKMMLSYRGPLGRINQNSSHMQQSTSEGDSNSDTISSIRTLTFKLGDRQQTFWFIKSEQNSLKAAKKRNDNSSVFGLSTTSTSKKDSLDSKENPFKQQNQQSNDILAFDSLSQECIQCCSIDFFIQDELMQKNNYQEQSLPRICAEHIERGKDNQQ